MNEQTVFCGFTPCSVFSDQWLSDPHMNGTGNWICNNCEMEADTDSYDGNGFIIRSRAKNWAGIMQQFDFAQISQGNQLSLVTGFFIQLLDGQSEDITVTVKVRIMQDDGTKKFMIFSPYVIEPSASTGWNEVARSATFDTSDVDWSSISGVRWFIDVNDETVDYKIDAAYLIEQKDYPALDKTPTNEDEPYFLKNHDFEIDINAPGGEGWESVSGQEFKLKNVIDSAAPSGYQYLEVFPAAGGIKQDITNDVDIR